ncbi:MAG: ABC-F family ATP-binding cassette domain-containing protein [Bdellovibrionales bacterium]|nr:ABC-F family ATP-binding cassette domain-containing protein [Bdellovibrionales bacterium]
MIHASNISKGYHSKTLYKNASFQINPGEKIGLVGPNGAGKTTIFRIITGEERPDDGFVNKPEKLIVGYFSQNIAEMSGNTLINEVKSAAGRTSELQKTLQELEIKLSEPMDDDQMAEVLEKYGEAQSEFEAIGGYDIDSRAAEILTGLGFLPEEFENLTENYSGGWKMRIALAKILLLQPDVLLMDEPTNHLDIESILWLEQWLQNYKGSLLMTCHDREFMNKIVSKTIEIAHNTITTYSGNYDFYEKDREIRKEQLLASAKRQEDMLAKEKEFISRFAARASHAAQVQSRVKKLEKIDLIEVPQEEREIKFTWPTPPRGGEEVVKLTDLKKVWTTHKGDQKLVFNNINALVKRLDRVAVVGINGAGKSTLLKTIVNQTTPTDGEVKIGASIDIGYFSQNSLDVLNPNSTIIEEVQNNMPNADLGYIRNLLGAFKFSGDEVEKKISVLSGGEKSRVVLACILARPVNLLVLDEPTNHLDIGSREVLLEAIRKFPGTVLIVSHDRHFLRAITSRVFEIDKNQLRVFDGQYDEYLQTKAERGI